MYRSKMMIFFGLLSFFLLATFGNAIPLGSIDIPQWQASSVSTPEGSTIYYMISPLPMVWDEAFDFCQNQEGIMAEPRSETQTREIDAILEENEEYWIGS